MNVTNTPDHLLTRRKLRKNLKKFLLSLLQALDKFTEMIPQNHFQSVAPIIV